ncbi:MAG TPA: asparagine synthase (glutamine-hydrolyzing) [Acidimicrobiales bacterium]|nr:asparagine synthase (glutamine-hydrolyzing) [Acidimicrobiales bacterium]
MCGIAGFWDRGPAGADEAGRRIVAMTDTLRHRGPDDAGDFVEEAAGLALGARRLAIVDLSEHGHQPMVSPDGRFVLAFNGEIYNFADLRAELEATGTRFRGTSDTEVLVTAVQAWGLRQALVRCNGMFALALWDRRERRLHLARDRFGEKPLYYGWSRGAFLFGSELKALRAHPAFAAEVDRDVVALYFRHNCVPAPFSIYRGIAKLPVASIVTLEAAAAPGTMPTPEPFWSLRAVAEAGAADRVTGSVDAVTDQLDTVLRDAVRLRMHADVPLGAFLSGGIDSSLVVALMQAQATAPVRTFTIAFDDAAYDEADEARAVAGHLGTEHHELLVTAADALDVVALLPDVYDEPFADSSQIPTAVLARLTRTHVTVALSGDGGDELFGGYNRYAWAERFWRRVEPVPRPLRRAAAAALGAVPPGWWDRAFAGAGRVVPRVGGVRMPGTKLAKVAQVLPAADLHATYVALASHLQDPGRLVPGAVEPPTLLTRPEQWPANADGVERMMFLDTMTYLPDDILTKVDRATMASSLEGRMPFLDPAVAALAWRLPTDMKVRGGTGKWLLRRLLHRYVPPALVERPKAGFGIPVGDWLRGPLRPWAEELLDPRRMGDEGLLAPAVVQELWGEHLSGRRDRQFELWDVLMFQAWLGAQSRPPGA